MEYKCTYYRTNSGTVTIELHDLGTGRLLMRQTLDASEITEAQIITLESQLPIENIFGAPLMLRMYSDSPSGNAVAPMITFSESSEEHCLIVNGAEIPGTLCYAAAGTDYIWAGLNYWKFATIFGVILAGCFVSVLNRYKSGKRSYIASAITAMYKYNFLIRQLISRDFKTKYKRSVLGVFWSFLNPLLTMTVQYFVFSTIFKSDIPNYAVYLLVGIIVFNFFSEACGMSLTAILGNAPLIKKVYMPKYIYPLTRVLSSIINLGISLIPFLIVALFTGVHFTKAALLSLFFFVCLMIFSLGLALLLSSSMVFFRDTQFLWGILNMIWMYATPIFYPENILPEKFRFIHYVNPLYHFLKNARMCLLDGFSPEPAAYAQSLLVATMMLTVGTLVFRKTQDKFVLYL